MIISEKKIVPKSANDVKLINAGKVLENNKTIAQCRMPFGELPGGVITMHVVVQPSPGKTKMGTSKTPFSIYHLSSIIDCIMNVWMNMVVA